MYIASSSSKTEVIQCFCKRELQNWGNVSLQSALSITYIELIPLNFSTYVSVFISTTSTHINNERLDIGPTWHLTRKTFHHPYAGTLQHSKTQDRGLPPLQCSVHRAWSEWFTSCDEIEMKTSLLSYESVQSPRTAFLNLWYTYYWYYASKYWVVRELSKIIKS